MKKAQPWLQHLRHLRHIPGALLWTAGIVVVLVIGIFTFSFADEPLRSSMERKMNDQLVGYTVRLPKAHFSLFGLAVTLEDASIRQQGDTTNAPIAVVPKLRASLQWSKLLSLRLVSDVQVTKPQVRINLAQVRHEVDDSVPVKDHGWQEAAAQIHPFKINLVEITDGDLVYVDTDKSKPLHIAHVNVKAGNVRNILSKRTKHPSTIHADGVVFDKGTITVDGRANFLTKPTPSLKFTYAAHTIPLQDLAPVATHADLKLKGGTLESTGAIETGPDGIAAHVDNVAVDGLHVDYLQKVTSAVANVAGEAKKAAEKPAYTLVVDTVSLKHGELGVTRERSSHSYRLFLTDASFNLSNYSNHFVNGPGDATLRGRFMGQGRTAIRMQLRPAKGGQNFDLAVAIDSTPLVTMNEMLLAHGKFDVVKGTLELYSELNVQNGRMTGYVKPILQGVKIYDPKQDGRNAPFAQLWELILSGAAKLFENRKTHEVAMRATINGPAGETTANTWELIRTAFENAFINAITPGFDRKTAAREH